ncbi:MAG: hypothetical protein FWH00_03795, partial [Oscillospiraceae bacterium]|nr:hypothetical protein [Oscillospiraceae bacterium]
MPTFSKWFGAHLDISGCGELLDAAISNAVMDKQNNAIQITLKPVQVVHKKRIGEIARYIAKELSLTSCVILPRYEPQLFSAECFPDILESLRGEGVPVNGFFAGAEISLEDDTLRVKLQNGGADFLNENKAAEKISRVILEE